MSGSDESNFAIYREKILYLLDLHTKQLEKIDVKIDTKLDLLDSRLKAVEDRTDDIDSGLFLAKKGLGAFIAEGLKIATAIFTAYLIIRFGLER